MSARRTIYYHLTRPNRISYKVPPTLLVRTALIVGLLIAPGAAAVYGQAIPTAGSQFSTSVFGTVSALNSQLPYYSDNMLGYNFGISVKPMAWLGLEARGGMYTMSATFQQAPFTVGILVDPNANSAKWHLYSYTGAGFSKAQAWTAGFKVSAPMWQPCWQVSEGLDVPLTPRVTWRMAEASLTETYTSRRGIPDQSIRGLSLSTGIVYHFRSMGLVQ